MQFYPKLVMPLDAVMICKAVFSIFLVLYIIAFMLWLMGTYGWFGTAKDPLSGVFLVILGQPWTRWVNLLPAAWWPVAAALMPGINAAIIYLVCRLLNRGS